MSKLFYIAYFNNNALIIRMGKLTDTLDIAFYILNLL